jgi:hypothetical protein
LRQVDKRIGLSKAVAQALEDIRRQASCKHISLTLLRQRVYALAGGYEDLNDHQPLRHDLAIRSAVEREEVLASSSTLCRWENQANRQTAWHIHQVIIERFVASFKPALKQMILDFDATDDAVHGKQERCFFHGIQIITAFCPCMCSARINC